MKKILPGRGFYRTVTLFICLVIFLLSCGIPQHATQPINGYDAVRVFSISDTAATTLPDSVFRYINLEHLYLMPAEMAVYPPITAYTEKPMRFTGLPPSICQLKRLKLIDLTYNKLEDIPDLSCLDSLLVLNLAFNSGISIARRRDIGTIKKMKNLQVLFVAGTDYLKEDIVNLQQECKGLKVMTRYDDYFKYLDSLEKNLFRNRPQNDWHDGTK